MVLNSYFDDIRLPNVSMLIHPPIIQQFVVEHGPFLDYFLIYIYICISSFIYLLEMMMLHTYAELLDGI